MKLLIVVVTAMLFLTACGEPGATTPQGVNPDAVIPVTISDNGIETTVSEIVIGNFHKGANVDVIYRITNRAEDDLTPTVFLNMKVDPDKYDRAVGYEIAPKFVAEWVKLPEVAKIKSGKSRDIVVSLSMPDSTGKTPSKLAFRTGVAGNTGGMYQTAVETWWLVTMR